MVLIVGARSFAPDIGHAQRAPTMPGAQEIKSRGGSGPALRVPRNDEVEAQSRSERDRWTFYEVIKVLRILPSSLCHQESFGPLF